MRPYGRAAIIGICLLGSALIAISLYFKPSRMDDFLPFYRATHLLGSPDLFAQGNFGAGGLMFLRTPFYAWLLKPLGALAYPHARTIWIALMSIAFGLSVWLWPGSRVRIALAVCWTLPTLFALALGQDIALIMLVVSIAARLWMNGWTFAAGLVASLLALKVTLLLPVALVFLARSRRGFGGLLLGGAVQFAVSWALQGSGWIHEYLAAVRSPLLDQVPAHMPSVRALVGGIPFALIAIAIYGWLWKIARVVSPVEALAAALPLGIIAAPHCYSYDMAAAAPLLTMAASSKSAGGILAAVALSPAPYLLMSTGNPMGAALVILGVLGATSVLLPASKPSKHLSGAATMEAPPVDC